MEIPMNNNALTELEQRIVNEMTEKILKQLETDSTAYLYSYGTAYRENMAKIVGKEFKKKGYHVAYDYVPNGYRNIIVSRHEIGESSGRLVSRCWA